MRGMYDFLRLASRLTTHRWSVRKFFANSCVDRLASPLARAYHHLLDAFSMVNKMPLIYVADVNECNDPTNICHVNADCTNYEGFYTCECKSGYTGNGASCSGENLLHTYLQLLS